MTASIGTVDAMVSKRLIKAFIANEVIAATITLSVSEEIAYNYAPVRVRHKGKRYSLDYVRAKAKRKHNKSGKKF